MCVFVDVYVFRVRLVLVPLACGLAGFAALATVCVAPARKLFSTRARRAQSWKAVRRSPAQANARWQPDAQLAWSARPQEPRPERPLCRAGRASPHGARCFGCWRRDRRLTCPVRGVMCHCGRPRAVGRAGGLGNVRALTFAAAQPAAARGCVPGRAPGAFAHTASCGTAQRPRRICSCFREPARRACTRCGSSQPAAHNGNRIIPKPPHRWPASHCKSSTGLLTVRAERIRQRCIRQSARCYWLSNARR